MESQQSPPRPRRSPSQPPEREGSYGYAASDIESMDGGGGGAWRSEAMERNGSSEALASYDDREAASVREPLLRKRTMNTTSQIAIVGANVCPIESLDYE